MRLIAVYSRFWLKVQIDYLYTGNVMNRVKLLLASVCLLASSMASAGVMYTWSTLATAPGMRSLSGFIELSDAAAASGHVSYRAPSCDPWPCSLADPASPILRFAFEVNAHTKSALDIDLVAGTGYDFGMPSFDAEFDHGAGRIANLALFVNTLTSTLRIGGDAIEWFSSDADNCYFGCAGAQGRFAAADVPEPGSLALLALALLAGLVAPGMRTCVRRSAT
jgi:hypothetical protein